MEIVQNESGLNDRLLRPLSANFLADTLLLKQGWISRQQLYYISGRSRQKQLRLAEELGVNKYRNKLADVLSPIRLWRTFA